MRPTDKYYIVPGKPEPRDLCWFCDEYCGDGKMVRYKFSYPETPDRPSCAKCAATIKDTAK